MSTLKERLRRLALIAILPLSALPFTAFIYAHSNHLFITDGVRAGGSALWAAPAVTLSRTELAYKQPPAYTDTRHIPILLYHGVGYRKDPFEIAPEDFANQMALIQRLGFHTISMKQYLAWQRGEKVNLPSRPILITFDDGQFDTYRGADHILAKYHMRATMFAIVGVVQRHELFYCSWKELTTMQKSGRWDIQFHANQGHVQVPYDAKGDKGAYYSTREYKSGRRETMGEYETRVNNDISQGIDILRQHGFTDLDTMAMPFGEYGQHPTEKVHDFRAKAELEKILSKYFVSVFIQSGSSFTPYALQGVRGAIRQEIRKRTPIGELYNYLYRSDPTVLRAERRACTHPHTWDPKYAKCYR